MSGMNAIAVIGLDAQFCEQKNIDQVERALYLGKRLGKEKELNNTELSLSSCKYAIQRMAKANKVNTVDITTIVVSELAIDIDGAIVVRSLSIAIEQVKKLVEQEHLVALIGLNLNEQIATGIVEGFVGNTVEKNENEVLATVSFDKIFAGYQNCNGIASLLFSSINFAKNNTCYVYSQLKGFASGNDIHTTVISALNNANVNIDDIGLLEVSALAAKTKSHFEAKSLITSYVNQSQLTTAISCARSVTGEGAGFSQVLGLLRSVIALQQRYIPAISDWQQPLATELEEWTNSAFYFPTESRPWYPSLDDKAHLAAYSCLASNDDYCHLILEEHQIKVSGEKYPSTDIRHNGFIACGDLKLVLISGDDELALNAALVALETSTDSLKTLAQDCFEKAKNKTYIYTAVLICESKEELLKEIHSAKIGIKAAFYSQTNKQKEWRTPKGSYFTSTPVNDSNENSNNVSFLYPGIGATYVGLGRDLFHLFPEIHQDVANLAEDIGSSLKDTLLNPRTIIRPDFKELKQLDLNLRGNLADIAEAGVGFACVFTKVFENVFKVKADYATGYSMGEVSMYAALGAWQQPGLMSARLAHSDTFNHRLCGDLLTLREHWGLSESSIEQTIWETYTIKATLNDVVVASEGEDRVYCTIINTPDSLLLAGYPEACLRVIKKLGVRAMALNMANAIHSAPANKEYDDMVELYTMDVTTRLKTKMYSSSCYLPVPQLSKAIAHSVAKCLCDRVDFPRLINTLHEKGARVFIEMGPGRSLCSWVDKILDFDNDNDNDHEHSIKPRVSVPVNAKGTSDELTYFRAIAKLMSHGVKLDIETLFNGSIVVIKDC